MALFFGGYRNILPEMLILLASRAIYSCIPLKAIQYYINIDIFTIAMTQLTRSCQGNAYSCQYLSIDSLHGSYIIIFW